MKLFNKFLFFYTVLILTVSCKTTEKTVEYQVLQDSVIIHSKESLSIYVEKGKAFNHPTFVFWKEDLEGNYIETIFITHSYASGIFGHHMINDSTWSPSSGPSYQPAALPYWTFKKGLIKGQYLVPTKEHPYTDAYTGATPHSNFKIEIENNTKDKYRILCEVNQPWDWNEYWTNNKFPESNAYKHSAQPSLIYAVNINNNDTIYYLNPIGHGSPTGKNGKLYTNLNTLTTAKEIFKTIKIITRNNNKK